MFAKHRFIEKKCADFCPREIKLAAELFWRVDVPPSKIVMGFGFYGRSFTLASSGCTTPGCGFSGASDPGPCTKTGGYLAYYEVQSVLKNNPSIKPVHDEDAAVKYFVWNTNQWISYDDADTYKQKVDWADGIGLGGAMIWASDGGLSTTSIPIVLQLTHHFYCR